MTRDEILKKVTQVTTSVLNVDPDQVKPESNFVFDLGAESVQSIHLVSAFEEAFNIEMDSDAAMEVQTVNGAVDFIAQHLSK
jgi:acyl carrier protein